MSISSSRLISPAAIARRDAHSSGPIAFPVPCQKPSLLAYRSCPGTIRPPPNPVGGRVVQYHVARAIDHRHPNGEGVEHLSQLRLGFLDLADVDHRADRPASPALGLALD